MYNTCGLGLCGLSASIQICGEERWDSWLGRPHCPFYTPVSSEASFPEVPNPQFSELLVVGSHLYHPSPKVFFQVITLLLASLKS